MTCMSGGEGTGQGSANGGAARAPPVGWRYRGADGVEHYVGALSEIPAGLRASARPVSVADIPLNPELEKGLEKAAQPLPTEQAPAKGPAIQPGARWLPGLPVLVGSALLLGALATLLHRLYRRRYTGNERLWRAARVSTWLTGLAVLLVLVRLVLAHLAPWKKELSRFGLDALVAEEDRNSEIMRANIQKAALDAAGLAPPAPKPAPTGVGAFEAPPPPGLLHP